MKQSGKNVKLGINKTDFIKQIAGKMGTTQKAASENLEVVLNLIKENLREVGLIKFIGFGTFKVRRSAARIAKNPQSGKPIDVPAQNRVSFSAGSIVKEYINIPQKRGK